MNVDEEQDAKILRGMWKVVREYFANKVTWKYAEDLKLTLIVGNKRVQVCCLFYSSVHPKECTHQLLRQEFLEIS